jgi:hypothetical protein
MPCGAARRLSDAEKKIPPSFFFARQLGTQKRPERNFVHAMKNTNNEGILLFGD